MREAGFHGSGVCVGPITLDLRSGERMARVLESPRDAAALALMAAGIVKASSGQVLIDEYDPRVQPAHCKRITGFVPHDPLTIGELSLEQYVAYRAALWNVDRASALDRAKIALQRLEGVHEAFAYPLLGALIAEPQILVLDRPQPAYAAQILAACGARALFSTHVSPVAAAVFA
jgi:ABC-type sulfate/molybdate transport systems ATPase subunit